MAQSSLGGVPFNIDPSAVQWDFTMKTSQQDTLGGIVVQIYGTELGDMTVQGYFGNGRPSRGDTAGWEEQERFRVQVQRWARQAQHNSGGNPIRFLFPSQGWDFQVFVKSFTSPDGASVTHTNEISNPRWALTLFIVEDSTQRVIKGIKDSYLQRLMTGVGWKQTEYNGPTAEAVAKRLNGGTVEDYVQGQFEQAASGNSDANAQAPVDSATGGAQASVSGGDLDTWITTAFQVMGMNPEPYRNDIKTMVKFESSGNPRAINLTDSNAKAGHPTKGLLQMRDDTFAAHALAPYDKDIYDPVSNIISSVRYGISRYGSIDKIPGIVSLNAGKGYVGY